LVLVFEVSFDEYAVIEKRFVGLGPESFSQARTPTDKLEGQRPVRGAQRNVHRADPVDSGSDRVGSAEVAQLASDLDRKSIVLGQPERLPEQRPVLAPRELPGKLDVGATGPHALEIPVRDRHATRKAQ